MDIYTISILVSIMVYIAVGNYAGRRVKDLDDYFVASLVNWSAARRLPSLISDRLTFFQRGKFWLDLEDWQDKLFARITTGIRSDLTPRTFLEAKIVWEYDSEPVRGVERQDIDYIFGLGVRF